MTGAGSALPVAFAMEDEFMGGLKEEDGEPTFVEPGIDPQVEELDLQRQLERVRRPDDPIPLTSLAQNLEGAASVSFVLTDDNWHDLVFEDGLIEKGLRPSARWHFGVDLIEGTVERITLGTVVTQVQIQYQQDQNVRVTLTMLYGDEVGGDSDEANEFDPTDVERPAKSDVFASHSTSLEIDDAAVETYLQSAGLTISNLARFRRGAGFHPVDAVPGAVEPDLSTNATFTESDRRDIAYGGSTPATMLDEIDATLEFDRDDGSDPIAYDLEVKPDNYAWNDLVQADTDLGEDINWHVSHVEAV
ncbi:phage tail tube protein [Natronobacterium gregoryi]|uniref:Uncharacterized protein n=2 Tax=Natronobacterium gregoryi TaxID=44930 RepID=L0AM78_NATGS|nr:phage tail tube protein [Natronobacterium gregoryi]AFZ74564.1 hypothetical protein Natgr_3445 [Natronobacterium gregoryi SP2]ELY72366.1 hypothetical protein C490_03443 [Natronobacterium gregoryi SP2]PLK21694.1 hypothetical protein CYV19_02335 [Natronobacterium gregoryi SP2]SFI96140.1 hypothetical protein SAMN05443661_110141 [Natronobacterium gregoryi]